MKNCTYLAKSFPAKEGNAAVRLVPMASASWLFEKEISLTFPVVTIRPKSALLGTAFNLLSKRTKVLERERVAWLMLTILPILPGKSGGLTKQPNEKSVSGNAPKAWGQYARIY